MRDYVDQIARLRECASNSHEVHLKCGAYLSGVCAKTRDIRMQDAADAIEELLAHACPNFHRNVHDRGDDSYCDVLNAEPPKDERTAFWVDTQPHLDDSSYKKDGMSYYCSNCHHRAGKYKHRSYKFCPWCGAKIVPKEMAVRNED